MSNENLDESLKKAIKVARVNKLIQAVILIVFGLVLMIWSGTAINIICKVIAAIIAIAGIAIIVAFLIGRNSYYGTPIGLFGGVVAAVLGIYLFSNPVVLASLGPTMIGMIIIVTGIVDLTEAVRIEKQRSGGTMVAMAIAAVELILGVIFILHPTEISNILFILMGLCLLLDGLSDIWLCLQIGKPEKVIDDIAAARAAQSGEVIDGETRPLNEGGAKEEKSAAQEQSFVDRAKARAASKKQEREAKKAAESAAAAEQPAAETTASSEDGYTTIPHVSGDVIEPDSKES